MIVLSLFIPRLATDLVRRRSGIGPRVPILLSRDEHQREVVGACCEWAERAGVAPGMTVSQAGALLPSSPVHQEPWDGALLSRAIRRLAAGAARFTPNVAPDGLDGLWLDCTGCTHLHGGSREMAVDVADYFARRGYPSRIGVAPTMSAARALARFGDRPIRLVDAPGVADALAPLPVGAMRLDPEQVEALRAVGVTTIADLMKISRPALAERFGGGVVRRLDQALGREPESFVPIRTRPPLCVGRAFAGPTDRPESIAICVRQLLDAIAVRLERRQAGCRELLAVLRRSDLPPVEVLARAMRPTRDPRHWYTLLRPRLERANLGFGVEGVEIAARAVRPLRHEQMSRWLDASHGAHADEFARLADTLKARLGEGRVLRMRPRASFLPERSWVAETVETLDGETRASSFAAPVDRPTRLWPRPAPIDVVFLVPDGPIGRVSLDGEGRQVLRCRGPERISGEWWRDGYDVCGTRDYYQLHTDDGAWLWVFRVVESGRWFLHGEWA